MPTLEDTRRDELLAKLARFLICRGLRTPAIWFLAMHEPLSILGGQMLLFSEPLLAPFVGDSTIRDYVSLLEDRGNVRRLLDLLERESCSHPVKTANDGDRAASHRKEEIEDGSN